MATVIMGAQGIEIVMVHLQLGWVVENVFGQVLTSIMIFLCYMKNTHLAYSPISSYGKCLEIINALE